jgi:hypothetical protein
MDTHPNWTNAVIQMALGMKIARQAADGSWEVVHNEKVLASGPSAAAAWHALESLAKLGIQLPDLPAE